MKICIDGPWYVGEHFVASLYTEPLKLALSASNVSFHFLDQRGAAEHAVALLLRLRPTARIFIYNSDDADRYLNRGAILYHPTYQEAREQWCKDCDFYIQSWPALQPIQRSFDCGLDPTARQCGAVIAGTVVDSIARNEVLLTDSALKRIAAILEEEYGAHTSVSVDDERDEVLGVPTESALTVSKKRLVKRRQTSESGATTSEGSREYRPEQIESSESIQSAATSSDRADTPWFTTERSVVEADYTFGDECDVLDAEWPITVPLEIPQVDTVVFDQFWHFITASRQDWQHTEYYRKHSISLMRQMTGGVGVQKRGPQIDELFYLASMNRVKVEDLLLRIMSKCWLCGTSVRVTSDRCVTIDLRGLSAVTRAHFPLTAASCRTNERRIVGGNCAARLSALIVAFRALNSARHAYRKEFMVPGLSHAHYTRVDTEISAAQSTFAIEKRV